MSTGGQQWSSGVHRPSPRSRRPGFVSIKVLAAVAVVVALVAGSLGYFLGRRSNDAGTATTNHPAKTSIASSTVSTVATTAAVSIDRKLTTVVVANGSGIKGAAAVATTDLKSLGYVTLAPANTTGSTVLLTTQVFAITGSEQAAAQVVLDLHLTNVVAVPMPVDSKLPVPAASLQGAGVVVILGTDAASRIAASAATSPGTGAIANTAPANATPAPGGTAPSGVTSPATTIKR